MAMERYLVVETRAFTEAGGPFTRRHPGAVLDDVVWTTQGPEGTVHNVACLARDLPPGSVDELVGELTDAFGEVETHRRSDTEWFGSFTVPGALLADPAAMLVSRFATEIGIQALWLRLEEGTAYARCLLPADADEQDVASRFQAMADAAGVDVDVGVEASESGMASPWDELMRQALPPDRDRPQS